MFLDVRFGYVLWIVLLVIGCVAAVKRRLSSAHTIAALALATYLALLLSVTLLPMSLTYGVTLGIEYESYPLPGSYLASMWEMVTTGDTKLSYLSFLLRHAFAYAPLGFLLPAASARCARFKTCLVAVALASLFVELAQLVEGLAVGSLYKIVSLDEVLLALLGGTVGFSLFQIVCFTYNRIRFCFTET